MEALTFTLTLLVVAAARLGVFNTVLLELGAGSTNSEPARPSA
jgi:hypothetical protein